MITLSMTLKVVIINLMSMKLFGFATAILGLGSDGILVGPLQSEKADFGLRILNPDGSEAEKSGNGLRIFARYLFDQKKVNSDSFLSRHFGWNCDL